MFKTLQTRSSETVPGGIVRHVLESLVLLAIAVTTFRAFAVEGFMISTGSMAPTLLGYHRDIVCPACQFAFPTGAAVDEESDFDDDEMDEIEVAGAQTPEIRCPNCSLIIDNLASFPRTEGDQLLVHKLAYDLRDPRRWEVTVFRNPADTSQAYVKRVVGLPGEAIELKHGHVYANGKICRRPMTVQRAQKVPVSQYSNRPDMTDPDAKLSWFPSPSSRDWGFDPAVLKFGGKQTEAVQWVDFHHWTRAGGQHETRVSLLNAPSDIDFQQERYSRLKYENGQLSCVGVLTDVERRSWLTRSDSPEFHNALQRLFEQSHITPIVDESGYVPIDLATANAVSEFFVTVELAGVEGDGVFCLRLRHAHESYTAIFDFTQQRCRVVRDGVASGGGEQEVASASIVTKVPGAKTLIEFSTFDRQISLAVNGQDVIAPFLLPDDVEAAAMSSPFSLGARNLNFEVTQLELARNVYYRPAPDGKPNRFTMKNDEFFVLGDNSPVSVDSRYWPEPGIHRDAFIGKPLFVHLPSRAGKLRFGGTERVMRVPNFSKIRVIR